MKKTHPLIVFVISVAAALFLLGCGTPVQHVAQDCKSQNEKSFLQFADCTKSNFMADPSGTSPSYYNTYLEELKKLASLVKKKKLTDDEAFYEESKFRLDLDTKFAKIEEPGRTATGLILMGTGVGMLQKSNAPPSPAQAVTNCYAHSNGNNGWARCQ